MRTHDIDSLERATLAAVPPQQLQELDGWLLPLDDGTVGRAHSAVPLRHEDVRGDLLEAIQARYSERRLAAAFRLPQEPAFDALKDELDARRYSPSQPTLTMVAAVEDVASLAAPGAVELANAPHESWSSVFLGEGFDPVDGASRVAILRRAHRSLFAAARFDGRVVAVGSACYAHDWCGIHGMRTLPAWRGRGLASSILAALAREAQRRGITRAFLQVEQANAPAQSLYRRAGFGPAWTYEYWRRA
ncbi:MAG TPA: GNAT family N-acetyltransferase [Ramlibacter sp.]|nr:GNAT family N-acetyltransferase [Ramlibacter sp.]